jgi:hypothetical protein
MAILQTRYRDVPWEEARACYKLSSAAYKRHPNEAKRWDENFRGKPVLVTTPPVENEQFEHVECDGPFYRLSEDPGKMVCVHIAEIGD